MCILCTLFSFLSARGPSCPRLLPRASLLSIELLMIPPAILGQGDRQRRGVLQLIALLVVGIPVVWFLIGSEISINASQRPTAVSARRAPDFSLTLFDGTEFNLARHLSSDGRALALNFWASWCAPCRAEMPTFDSVAHKRLDVLILGVAIDDTEDAARAFATEVRVGYPLGIDVDGAILELYPSIGLPTTWFVTADGVIADVRVGPLDEDLLNRLIDQLRTG